MDGRCDWGNPKQLKRAGCKKPVHLGYCGKELCKEHWFTLCEWQDKGKEDAAYIKMGLPPRQQNKKIAPVKVGNKAEPEEVQLETPVPLPQSQPFRKRRR